MITSPGFKSSPVSPSASQIVTPTQRITILTDGLVRFETDPDGKFEDRASTFAINRDAPTPQFEVLKRGEGMEILTDRFLLKWTGGDFSPSSVIVSLRQAGECVHRRKLTIDSVNLGWTHIWQYGDKHEKLSNLGGTYRTLDNIDGRCDLGDGILSEYGFSQIDDSGSMIFTEDGWVAGRDPAKKDVYLFAYGLAMKAFYMISGRTPLIPRWALGNWWSRYYPYSDKEYLGLMDRFKSEQIPLSVAVLDIDWHKIDVPKGFGTGWTGYTWDTDRFPDHVGFLKELHDRKLKVTLNTHPADGVRSFEDKYEEMCKALGRDSSSGTPVPFEATNKHFLKAYFEILHHPLEDEGVDFWWLDWQQGPFSETSGIDPLWMLNHYHYLDSGRKGERRFTFSRYSGPGSHRYPIGFSGDTIISWDSLKFQPEFTATASNIGYGWWSHDIGGHYNGTHDDEVMARWVQLGAFSPILRLHSSTSPFNTREPWVYSEETQKVVTAALQFRHRLIPYIYSCAVVAATECKNLVEPVYYDYPESPEAYAYKTQFTFGPGLMVLPIVSPKTKETQLGKAEGWLPPGRWVDLFTETVYDGDRVVSLHRPTDQYPVLAKEGAIIPLDARHGKDIENGAGIPEAIEVVLVVGKDGAFDLVEDDGKGAEVEDVKFSRTPIRYDQAGGVLTIGPSENPLQAHRTWSVRLLAHTPASVTLSVDGKKADTEANKNIIHLGQHHSTSTLSLNLGANPSLDKIDHKPHVFKLLQRANIGVNVKGEAWDAVERLGKEAITKVLGRLKVTGIDEGVREAIEELLLADLG